MTPTGGWMKLNDTKLKALGIDFFHQTTEWMSQVLTCFGGVKADKQGFTGVPGLYVAGRARSVTPGVYMGGWDSCLTATTGWIAGENAGLSAASQSETTFDESLALDALREDTAPLGREGVSPKDIVRKMQRLMSPIDVCILKTQDGLARSLSRLEAFRDEVVPLAGASDPHYLVKLTEARGMTLITEAFLRASLLRKESRAGHYRADFPHRDDTRGPAWINVRKGEHGMEASFDAVPLDRYPVKPYRYYMDNFNFPVCASATVSEKQN